MRPQVALLAGLLAFSSACGREAICTARGVTFLGQENSHGQEMPEGWSCTRFSLAIEVIIEVFDRIRPQPAFERERFTQAILGFGVAVRDEGFWYSPIHRKEIAGYTDCVSGYMLINKYPPNVSDTLAHEMVHVGQGCWPVDHHDWDQKDTDGDTLRNMESRAYVEIREAFVRLDE